MKRLLVLMILLLAGTSRAAEKTGPPADPQPRTDGGVRVAPDGKGFVLAGSGRRFVPWGYNYGPEWGLPEDRWETDWATIAGDFREMRELGANVIRFHLQFGKFMEAPDRPNQAALDRLGRVVKLAEETGVYLDVTGLACYRTADVPAWYDALDEPARWEAQARFWEAVAARCAQSPAIFCYDLMNEPVVPGGKRKPKDWYSGQPLGGFDFVQFIALDQAERPREEIARQWIRKLTQAIRKKDRRHLVTVGLLPWDPKWGNLSGFLPEAVAPELDFVSVHIYPEKEKVPEALAGLRKFAVGKPVVIEETFPLTCSSAELEQFLLETRGVAAGWMGHFFGETPAQLDERRHAKPLTPGQAIAAEFLRLFVRLKPEMGRGG